VKRLISLISYLSLAILLLNISGNVIATNNLIDNIEGYIHNVFYLNLIFPFVIFMAIYHIRLHLKYEQFYTDERISNLIEEINSFIDELDNPESRNKPAGEN
jgi:hypothetical protein